MFRAKITASTIVTAFFAAMITTPFLIGVIDSLAQLIDNLTLSAPWSTETINWKRDVLIAYGYITVGAMGFFVLLGIPEFVASTIYSSMAENGEHPDTLSEEKIKAIGAKFGWTVFLLMLAINLTACLVFVDSGKLSSWLLVVVCSVFYSGVPSFLAGSSVSHELEQY